MMMEKLQELTAAMTGISDKHLALVKATINAAIAVTELVKQLPRDGKFNRNIFIKNYNRRPRNKIKRAAGFAGIGITTACSVMEISELMSRPLPREKVKEK